MIKDSKRIFQYSEKGFWFHHPNTNDFSERFVLRRQEARRLFGTNRRWILVHETGSKKHVLVDSDIFLDEIILRQGIRLAA